MNMDYSKAFELLNQDAEKEKNKKAEKAVHDNLYNKGFRDGLAVLDKIRAEIIEKFGESECAEECGCLYELLEVIDKHKGESEDKK